MLVPFHLYFFPPPQSGLIGEGWVSGVVITERDTSEAIAARARVLEERKARRDDPANPRVFFDIEINGEAAGRVRAPSQGLQWPSLWKRV